MLRRTILRRTFPFSFLFIGLGRTVEFHQNDVYADFFNLFQGDKQIALAPVKAFTPGHDNAEHSSFGEGKHDVAHFSQALSVEHVDGFFFFEFLKTCFHALIVCSAI